MYEKIREEYPGKRPDYMAVAHLNNKKDIQEFVYDYIDYLENHGDDSFEDPVKCANSNLGYAFFCRNNGFFGNTPLGKLWGGIKFEKRPSLKNKTETNGK